MIRASDIAKIEKHKKEVKKETYLKIYEQFSRKIKQSVEFGNSQVFLTVPGYILGYPPFDRDHAAAYLKRQLILGEFGVQPIDQYTFFVTWGHQTDTKKEKSQEEQQGTEDDFPTLMNLKKAANKYRKNFPGKP